MTDNNNCGNYGPDEMMMDDCPMNHGAQKPPTIPGTQYPEPVNMNPRVPVNPISDNMNQKKGY